MLRPSAGLASSEDSGGEQLHAARVPAAARSATTGWLTLLGAG